MGENFRRFKEQMKGTSFRKQVVDPYVGQMDLKQTVETQKTIVRCENKAVWVMILFYAVFGCIGGVIAGWIWIMDYLGYFPYVTGDTDIVVCALIGILPISVYFGYEIALVEFKGSVSKRIKKIAGVEDGEEEKITD